jgi:hypothetical protein
MHMLPPRRIVRLVLALAGAAATLSAQAVRAPHALPDYDARHSAAARPDRAVVQQRENAVRSFSARAGTRAATNRHGLPKILFRSGRPLSAPSSQPPEVIARGFLYANPALFPFDAPEIENLRLAVQDASDGAVYLVFNQTLDGIDVYNGLLKFVLNPSGEIVATSAADAVPQLRLSTTPRLTPEQAVRAAFHSIGHQAPRTLAILGTGRQTRFRNPGGDRLTAITAELSVFPMSATSARLAYRVSLEADDRTWYEILIDAGSGELLARHSVYKRAAQARVWTKSPNSGTRQLINLPESWIPPTSVLTTGNNVDAYLDVDGNDTPDSLSNATMQNGRAFSMSQVFDFPFGDGLSGQDPRGFQAAAVTNLFYFVNMAHDYFYGLGFTEASGAMQTDNFGRGGKAGDPVRAEAQYGGFTNNAESAISVDGISPKIRAGLYTRGTGSKTDDLDSDFEGSLIVHEYAHAVNNRLVGGGTSVSCLVGIQGGAMDEGWSDYFAPATLTIP